ncbi:MAG TPA: hypothetical protein VIJ00_18395, partial [Nakamurella sp.]
MILVLGFVTARSRIFSQRVTAHPAVDDVPPPTSPQRGSADPIPRHRPPIPADAPDAALTPPPAGTGVV